jgi:2-oxoisovalerate ferredoxin oxidoreductase beta subunit
MYDNEAYMNTGIQRSSSTPVGAWTTTTQVGEVRDYKQAPKKNMVEIMVAHGIPYAATANIAWPKDVIAKVKKAMEAPGPAFVHIFAPCPTGWRYPPDKTLEIAKQATLAKVFPLYEVENGVYRVRTFKKEADVGEYLMRQGRFRHLTQEEIDRIKENVLTWYDKLLKCEAVTRED